MTWCALHYLQTATTMSVTGLASDPNSLSNKTFRRHNVSGELGVFEASRYFYGEPAATPTPKILTGDQKQSYRSDYHSIAASAAGDTAADRKIVIKDEKHEQPSSPGGRLASFLNSLFGESKTKPKSTARGQYSGGGGRRKRRSSIGHFSDSHKNPNQSTPIYSVSTKPSGSRSHPVQPLTRTGSGYRETVALPLPERLVFDASEKHYEKFGLRYWRNKDFTATVASIDKPLVLDQNKPVFKEVDDGTESDSSSDLFELENYDLGGYSRGCTEDS